MPVAAVGAIAAVGTAASAAAQGRAQKKALNNQMKALSNLRDVDPQEYARIAKQGDIDAWKTRLAAIQKVDPKLGELRNNAIKALTTSLAKNANSTNASDETYNFITGLAQQFAAGAPADFDLGSAMQAKAKEVMGRGSNLPPTYQAELIRSGLEKSGTVGIGPDRKGAVAGVLGKLLGSEAVAMEQQNAQFAGGLASAAQQISGNRMNILSGLSAQMQQFEANKQNLATGGLDVVNNEVPSKIGASGSDLVNIYEAKRTGQNAKISGAADLDAQKTLAKGRLTSGLIDSGTMLGMSMMSGLASPKMTAPKTTVPTPQDAPMAGLPTVAAPTSVSTGGYDPRTSAALSLLMSGSPQNRQLGLGLLGGLYQH